MTKALLVLPYLAPYRVDIINALADKYQLTVLFLYPFVPEQRFEQDRMLQQLKAEVVFLQQGFQLFGRPFRFGVIDLVNRFQPDVIFANEFNSVSLILSMMRFLRRKCFRLVLTTSDNAEMARTASLARRIARRLVLWQCQIAIVYGEEVAEWYRDTYPGLEVRVCPNIQDSARLRALDLDVFEAAARLRAEFGFLEAKVVLYVGRLATVKALDLLIKAFSELERPDNNWRLVVVGDGPEKTRLQEEVRWLNLTAEVFFVGRFEAEELYAWYAAADLFVLPSKFEPFGAVVNEALVWGCPCVVSSAAGAAEYIVEGKNGVIFQSGSLDSLMLALSNVADNIERSRQSLMVKSFKQYLGAYDGF